MSEAENGTTAGAVSRAAPLRGPVLAVCGWSGAGKTTLLEAVIPPLVERGLAVAVVKGDAHGLDIDRPGKDSDKLFRAGADVRVWGPGEGLLRVHRDDRDDFAASVASLLGDHDLVLVEGHRSAPVDKVWLASDSDEAPPEGLDRLMAVLGRDEARPRRLLEIIEEWLPRVWTSVPVRAGLIIDGAGPPTGTRRRPVARDPLAERTIAALVDRVGDVVLIGHGRIPVACRSLPRMSASGSGGNPLEEMLAALRWSPDTAWLFCPWDLFDLSGEAVEWLLGQRAPGRWIVNPQREGGRSPLPAVCEPQARAVLERLAAEGDAASRLLARHPKVAAPMVPERVAWRWSSVASGGRSTLPGKV